VDKALVVAQSLKTRCGLSDEDLLIHFVHAPLESQPTLKVKGFWEKKREGQEPTTAYQVYLTNERKLAPSPISIAISALRFLYRITLDKDWSLEMKGGG
jgi:Phage integrase, N-terminal SAM-like domain